MESLRLDEKTMRQKWLITTREGVSFDDIQQRTQHASQLALVGEPIPMEQDEYVFEVLGPADLDKTLRTDDWVLSIYPSSRMSRY